MRLKNFFRFNGLKLTKNYALDWNFFWKIRNFKDGINFFNFDIDLDLYKFDHNPKFDICLAIFNYIIFEIEIYNINHVPNDEDEEENEE